MTKILFLSQRFCSSVPILTHFFGEILSNEWGVLREFQQQINFVEVTVWLGVGL